LHIHATLANAFSASMNAYLTRFRWRRRRPFFWQLTLHLELPVFLAELGQLGALLRGEPALAAVAVSPRVLHPAGEGRWGEVQISPSYYAKHAASEEQSWPRVTKYERRIT
jgi:hypothetical protein